MRHRRRSSILVSPLFDFLLTDPKWNHGFRVTPRGQPKQHRAKKEKPEPSNFSERELSEEQVMLFKSQLIAKVDQ